MSLTEKIRTFSKKSLIAYSYLLNKDFIAAYHHKIISHHLEQALYKPKRIILNIAPRHGKTFLVSQLFPTWFLGLMPHKKVILASYSGSLATDSGRIVRNIMQGEVYQSIFDTRLSADSTAKTVFSTTKNGSFLAVGKGGSIVGRGGDIIIVDDLVKSDQEARSSLHRKNIEEWWKNTLYTRLMPNGSIVVINTRWHKEDLTGFLLNNSSQDWEHISIPAINDKDEALWPEMYPIEILNEIKREIGSHAFGTQYQQNPSDPEGEIVKKEWVRFYSELPRSFEETILSWDLSFKGNDDSDFVVGQVWGKNGANYYLIDQVRGRWDFTTTLHQFNALAYAYPQATKKLIEDAANASALISVLKDKIDGIVLYKPKTDKTSRLKAVTPLFQAGNVHIPSKMLYDWVDITLDEWFSFPNAKNDDTVDAMTQALISLKDEAKSFVIAYGV